MSILQNNKKAAAGIGVVAAAAAVLALGAGTYAAFTDTEQTDATFAAGTLDLTIGTSGEAANLNFTGIYPGWEQQRTITIGNSGTIAGVLSLTATTVGDENGCQEPEQEQGVQDGCREGGNLADAIEVSVNGGGAVPLAALAQTANGVNDVTIGAGASVSVTLTFSVDEIEVGNEIQSDELDVTLVGTLDQA
jgi:spore coat-associated protein N